METRVTRALEGGEVTQEHVLYAIFLLFTLTTALVVVGINLLLIGAS